MCCTSNPNATSTSKGNGLRCTRPSISVTTNIKTKFEVKNKYKATNLKKEKKKKNKALSFTLLKH